MSMTFRHREPNAQRIDQNFRKIKMETILGDENKNEDLDSLTEGFDFLRKFLTEAEQRGAVAKCRALSRITRLAGRKNDVRK